MVGRLGALAGQSVELGGDESPQVDPLETQGRGCVDVADQPGVPQRLGEVAAAGAQGTLDHGPGFVRVPVIERRVLRREGCREPEQGAEPVGDRAAGCDLLVAEIDLGAVLAPEVDLDEGRVRIAPLANRAEEDGEPRAHLGAAKDQEVEQGFEPGLHALLVSHLVQDLRVLRSGADHPAPERHGAGRLEIFEHRPDLDECRDGHGLLPFAERGEGHPGQARVDLVLVDHAVGGETQDPALVVRSVDVRRPDERTHFGCALLGNGEGERSLGHGYLGVKGLHMKAFFQMNVNDY